MAEFFTIRCVNFLFLTWYLFKKRLYLIVVHSQNHEFFLLWYILILRIFTGEISFTHLRGKAGAETCLARAGGWYIGAYIKFRCTVVPKWVNFQLVWTIQCAWPSTIRVALPERDGRVVKLPRFEVLLDASQVPYMVSKNVSLGRNIMLASPAKYGPAFVSLYNQFCCKH